MWVDVHLTRVRLFFKGLENFKFPKEYEDILSSIFLNKLNTFFNFEPKFENFNFFTFSYFILEQFEEYDDYFLSVDGVVSVVVSSISEGFLRKLVAFLVDGNNIHFEDNDLSLFKFNFFDEVSFDSNESNFITLSPIVLNDKMNLFSFLESSLVNNYCKYYHLKNKDIFCEITTHKDKFQKFIDPKSNMYYYMLDLRIKGDNNLISFAYDVGLGNDTTKGCGMLDLY